MEIATKVIETTGTIDSPNNVHLDEAITIAFPTKVRVLILLPEGEEMSETEWLGIAARNPAFDFLKNKEEDIYTIEDGKPYNDKI